MMKAIYKIILFFAIFQLVVVLVNIIDVFPTTLYTDSETEDLRGAKGPLGVLNYLFSVPEIPGLGGYTTFTFGMIAFLFLVVGAAIARATHSWTPVIVVMICTTFVPMLTNSYNFFNKMFTNWNNLTLVYLGLIFGVGIVIIVLITIAETPTHGRSG